MTWIYQKNCPCSQASCGERKIVYFSYSELCRKSKHRQKEMLCECSQRIVEVSEVSRERSQRKVAANCRVERNVTRMFAANCRGEQSITRKVAANCRGEQLSHERSQWIVEVSELSLRHFGPFQTIGVTIIRWNFEEISRDAIFLRKAPKKPGNSSKFVCITFAQYCIYRQRRDNLLNNKKWITLLL